MSTDRDTDFGFAPAHDAPIRYMERVREYYLALGYGPPYQWAHWNDVPFTPLVEPLARSRVTLVTTAAPYQPDKGPQGPGAPYNAKPKFFKVYALDSAKDHDLRINHVAIDFKHTRADDPGTWFPLPALRRAADAGRVQLAPRVYGIPTNRSHRVTIGIDAPDLVARCKADGVDAAILVPNCPVCHQTVTIAARQLEAAGIATAVLGAAKDIVEHVGAPRLMFSDVPLGNASGKPHDTASQDLTLELGLRMLETAFQPRTTVQSPLRWRDDPDWKLDYSNPARLTPEEIAAKRVEFDTQKATAKTMREDLGLTRKA